jgi:hypothetical protein
MNKEAADEERQIFIRLLEREVRQRMDEENVFNSLPKHGDSSVNFYCSIIVSCTSEN